jgi:hypothetical protein
VKDAIGKHIAEKSNPPILLFPEGLVYSFIYLLFYLLFIKCVREQHRSCNVPQGCV